MSHSVESHLNLDVREYDRLIRTFSPGYDEMLGVVVDVLQRTFSGECHVLDLGTGTGALAFAIASKISGATVEAWDVDRKMLAVAQQRLAPFGERVTIVERSFHEPLPSCDAVVASFSLHHVRDRGTKTDLFRGIFAALRPGGVFLNADLTLSDQPELDEVTFSMWADFMTTQGWSRDQAYEHFSAWSVEDKYFALYDELTSLAGAGFSRPACFWKNVVATVYGGLKQQAT
jgi:tRNA (cmo5U34)-methyltransferase